MPQTGSVVMTVLSADGDRRTEGRGHGLPGLREERDAHAFGCRRRRDRRRLARAGPRARHLRSGEGRAGGVQARHRARRIQGAVKDSLKAELATRREVTVDENRCIGFMGKEGMVYATPRMVSDVEYTCRDFLLEHLDAGEDSVGVHVAIDHLAATPLGLEATVEYRIVEVDRRKVVFEFSVRDKVEEVGRGKHVRFVVETAKTRERLAAKRAKAGLA